MSETTASREDTAEPALHKCLRQSCCGHQKRKLSDRPSANGVTRPPADYDSSAADTGHSAAGFRERQLSWIRRSLPTHCGRWASEEFRQPRSGERTVAHKTKTNVRFPQARRRDLFGSFDQLAVDGRPTSYIHHAINRIPQCLAAPRSNVAV